MNDQAARSPRGALAGLLGLIERAGNRLPHPVTLFAILCAVVPLASTVAARIGVAVRHPRTGDMIHAIDLLTSANIQRAFTQCVPNFVGFAPLGTVLGVMIGIGVAERAGLISAGLRLLVLVMPRRALTATVVLAGILSNVASDAGNLVLPPLAAALFAAVGRHPLAGIAAAFGGIAAGFSANLLPSALDVMLAGLTQEAARLWEPGREVQIVCNYYFLAASVPFLTIAGAWTTERLVEPRLGPWTLSNAGETQIEALSRQERRGLFAAAVAAAGVIALFLLLVVPSWGPLRGDGSTTLERLKPFLSSMVALAVIAFMIPGVAFGMAAGRIRSDHDVARMAGETMSTMGTYIVLAFFAAQFVKYFEWSNLGAIIAMGGAELLRSLGVQNVPLFMGLLAITMSINLMIASASAKWTFLAPIFVPMFMALGYSPEATQVIYRVGDSCTNPITPLNPYFPIMLVFCQKYDPRAGIGSLTAMMLPYTLVFAAAWSALLLTWLLMGLQVGPGAALTLGGG